MAPLFFTTTRSWSDAILPPPSLPDPALLMLLPPRLFLGASLSRSLLPPPDFSLFFDMMSSRLMFKTSSEAILSILSYSQMWLQPSSESHLAVSTTTTKSLSLDEGRQSGLPRVS